MTNTRLCCAALAAVLLGCGQSDRVVTVDSASPQSTARSVLDGLAADDPGILWRALPPSYQRDVTGLVGDFATAMDAELYDRGFGLFGKLVRIAKTKKDFILGNSRIKNAKGIDLQRASANWNQVVGLFETFATSELRNLSSVSSLDIGDFLSGTGRRMLQQTRALAEIAGDAEYPAFERFKVSTGTGANTVTVTTDAGTSNSEKFVQVEGRWIPAELARDWDKGIAQAKKALVKIDLSTDKAAALRTISAIENALDSIASADTQEQFDRALGGAMMSVLMGAGSMGAAPPRGR